MDLQDRGKKVEGDICINCLKSVYSIIFFIKRSGIRGDKKTVPGHDPSQA
jgi:hypothetical protein